jgi:hypothetical protein
MVAVSAAGIRIGEDSVFVRWTDHEVDQVLALREEGCAIREIARIMDMPKSTVWALCAGIIRGKLPARYKRVKR